MLALRRFVALLLGLAFCSSTTLAQPYPNKSVRIITPFSAGSGPDSVLRLLGERY